MSQQITLVYADSCQIYRLGLQTTLQQFDDVQLMDIALNAAAVKRAVAELKPDVLVFELDMPGMEGVEICKWLEAEHPQTRSLALTMYQNKAMMKEVMEAGVHGVIRKGCSGRQLVSAIITVAEGGTSYCAECSDIVRSRNMPMEHRRLRDNEVVVLQLLCRGKDTREIAAIMHKSEGAVNGYRAGIAEKLGTSNPFLQAMWAVEEGLVNPKDCLRVLTGGWIIQAKEKEMIKLLWDSLRYNK